MILRQIVMQSKRLASSSIKKPKELKFSKSLAFQGPGKTSQGSQFTFDYYSTDAFAFKKIFSALGSLVVLCLYFGYWREPSDLDEIWSMPPHILTSNLERKMLRDQIKEAKEKGLSTELLQAQLEYVDVKEAALKVQFAEQNKKK